MSKPMFKRRNELVAESRDALYHAGQQVRDACIDIDQATFTIEHLPMKEGRDIWMPVVEILNKHRWLLHEIANKLEEMKGEK